MRQARVRQHAGDLAGKPSVYEAVRAWSPLYANLTLENHDEVIQRIAFPSHDLSLLEAQRLKMIRQPGEMFLRQIGKDLNLAQIFDQAAACRTGKVVRQITPR